MSANPPNTEGDMPGRWPANVIFSPEMAAVLDKQSGMLKSGRLKAGQVGTPKNPEAVYNLGAAVRVNEHERPADQGGASRFFLTAGYEPWELEWIYSVGLRPYGTETA